MYWFGGGVAFVTMGAVVWTYLQQRAAIERLEDRLAHLIAGISLLTDTTEGGLRDVALEIGRLAGVSEATKRPARATTQRRIATAARRGRSINDIAATEQVSEGEVRLRLQLEKARKGAVHAAVR